MKELSSGWLSNLPEATELVCVKADVGIDAQRARSPCSSQDDIVIPTLCMGKVKPKTLLRKPWFSKATLYELMRQMEGTACKDWRKWLSSRGRKVLKIARLLHIVHFPYKKHTRLTNHQNKGDRAPSRKYIFKITVFLGHLKRTKAFTSRNVQEWRIKELKNQFINNTKKKFTKAMPSV